MFLTGDGFSEWDSLYIDLRDQKGMPTHFVPGTLSIVTSALKSRDGKIPGTEFQNATRGSRHADYYAFYHLCEEGIPPCCSGGDGEKYSLYLFIKEWEGFM